MLPQVPREIVYVQKLHFFGFLLSLASLVALVIGLLINKSAGLIVGILGCLVAYVSTVRKQTFITPAKESVIRPLAQKLTRQKFTPKSAATAATQLFYQLGDKQRAENLLLAYIPSEEPLVHTTLADIYLNTNRPEQALACLTPVNQLGDPLVHWTYGKVFIGQGDFLTALKHLETSLLLIQNQGLPRAKHGFLNGKFMEWSIKSSLHHHLALCYNSLGDEAQAKRYLRRGNRYLLDYSLWRLNI